MTKDQAKAIVEKLVNRYAEQQKAYHAADYNETKTRRDFIDPFFKALGWDMDNEQDVAEPYREVIHEDKVKIQGKVKAPDYGFRLQGAKDRLFFVEAKKPSVTLKTNKESAFQVRRYGWNSRVSVSILTNFEEFIVYDCSKKPNANDSTSVARLKTITYDQFLQEFDFIYDTFSREAVVKGRFDNYVKSDTAKKGTVTPDKDFVISLEQWRRFIAIDVARNNLKLNEDELNFAVQLIIDRLIFLRFCEDRGVESYGQLKSAVAKGSAYEQLHDIFLAADDKYNSGLFDFDKDKITQGLKVTNKVIKGIIDEMYYPLSQYDFKALPVEVLGNAYEQFLGKVIRINKSHHAVIEEKPEVRKAGGVFYTPQYIVDYIVENTVGKLIAGKTPKEIEKIKIVDPACGSGSFLLGAFDYLLKYHQNYYHNNPPSAKSGIITPVGTLSTAEKKKILLNNIYGVDLDANAVEVSKLSLLLKCMEGETEASIKQQITMFNERVLPDLDNNIKDGNSLVDTDIYDSELDFGEEKKIKPFSWKKQFSEIFKQGGFDVLIGNPPYVGRSSSFDHLEKDYIKTHYGTSEGKYELYQLFIERSIKICKPSNAIISLITPQTWLSIVQSTKLRSYLLNNSSLNEIVFLGKDVFNASVDTIIFSLKTGNSTEKIIFKEGKELTGSKLPNSHILISQIIKPDYIIPISFSENSFDLINKINKNSVKIEEYGNWSDGVKIVGNAKDFAFQTKKADSTFFPMYVGSDIERYKLKWSGYYCCRDKNKILKHNASDIRLRDEDVFNKTKILVRKTGNKIIAAIDENKYYYEQSLFSFSLTKETNSIKLILALLNSSTSNYILKSNSFSKKETFPQIRLHWLKEFPIPKNILKSKETTIIKNIDLIITLIGEIETTKVKSRVEQIKQRIEHAEDKINQLVYELYELTPEEIAIIEEASK